MLANLMSRTVETNRCELRLI